MGAEGVMRHPGGRKGGSLIRPWAYEHFMEQSPSRKANPRYLACMSLADIFRDNAEDCAFLARRSEDEDTKLTFLRMESAWRTLANQQEQLDKKQRPTKKPRL
jgi:hypothetical protein